VFDSGSRTSLRMTMIAAARLVSYQILLQIAASDAHSDELLRSAEVDALSAQDRHLTTTLVLGTLRWQIQLDEVIRGLLARPDAKLAPEVAAALRMGAYQLLHLDRVPAHAVINDSVELVKHGKEKGRRGDGECRSAWDPAFSVRRSAFRNTSPDFFDDSVAVGASAWMVERWVRRYGVEAAEAILQMGPGAGGDLFAGGGGGAEPEGVETEPAHFLNSARLVVGGDLGRSALVREGRVRVQDEGSQLVAEVLAAQAHVVSAGTRYPCGCWIRVRLREGRRRFWRSDWRRRRLRRWM